MLKKIIETLPRYATTKEAKEKGKKEANKIIKNFDGTIEQVEGNEKEGYSFLIQDKNSNFKIWFDLWVAWEDIQGDWNKYIFNTTNIDDMVIKYFQEDDYTFEYCYNICLDYCSSYGLFIDERK